MLASFKSKCFFAPRFKLTYTNSRNTFNWRHHPAGCIVDHCDDESHHDQLSVCNASIRYRLYCGSRVDGQTMGSSRQTVVFSGVSHTPHSHNNQPVSSIRYMVTCLGVSIPNSSYKSQDRGSMKKINTTAAVPWSRSQSLGLFDERSEMNKKWSRSYLTCVLCVSSCSPDFNCSHW